ncbi:MAG: NAD(P)H-hydrate dehydratase, partial [Cyanobacteriota bacterium]|nr:NAD(P)H-hydrate dehydratase [Cyanobacteriota bacterium]
MFAAAPLWPPRDADHLLVSGGQMAALEQELFASGLPVEALMEKAALGVTARIQQRWGAQLSAHGAVVLVGPGHNGGDGLVIARELHLAGVSVSVWSPFERHKPLTASHLRHALWLGIPRLEMPPDPGGQALWIDALFGVGQQRAPASELEDLLAARERQRPLTLVAVDSPTGICSQSGRLLGSVAARAHSCYAIGLLKTGLVQDCALSWVGRLERIDLGVSPQLLDSLPADQPLGLSPGDLLTRPELTFDPAAGKYGRGRLLVVAGSDRYPGAAALALRGADASGCGSIQAAIPRTMASELWTWLPHAVVAQALSCHRSGHLDLSPLRDLPLDRLDAVLVGPGIGTTEAEAPPAETAAWEALQRFPGLLVIDADGLNRLNIQWVSRRRGPTWITPHRHEFDRMFMDLVGVPPLDAAAEASGRCGAVVLLKGAHTVVASPQGTRWQLLQSAPSAARAGLGDVLAGYAAGRGAMAMAPGAGAAADQLADQLA